MSPETLAHFGLTQEPFSKEIDDADLWLPPSKHAVLDELTDAVHARKSTYAWRPTRKGSRSSRSQ